MCIFDKARSPPPLSGRLKEAGGLSPLALVPQRVIHNASWSGSSLRRCSYVSLRPTCIVDDALGWARGEGTISSSSRRQRHQYRHDP